MDNNDNENYIVDYSEVIVIDNSLSDISDNFEIDMCKYSKMSYGDPSEIDCSTNTFIFIDVEDTQCYIWEYCGAIVVSFRGTESFGDAIMDMKMRLEPICEHIFIDNDKCPKVHRGFKKQFDDVVRQIDEKIKEFVGKSGSLLPIYFTGHSLGGGLATIASLYFSFSVSNPIICITFGSPRVGDNLFAKLFDLRIKHSIRFVNQEDPVPFMPPDLFYEHVGGIRYIDKHDQIHNKITENRFCNFLRDCMCCCCGKECPSHDHCCGDYYNALVKSKHVKLL